MHLMDDSSLIWDDGALLTIDQRGLPHEVRELRLRTVDSIIDAITTLAIRGAPAIGIAGAFGVVIAATEHTVDGVIDRVAPGVIVCVLFMPAALQVAFQAGLALAETIVPTGGIVGLLQVAWYILAKGLQGTGRLPTAAAAGFETVDKRCRIAFCCELFAGALAAQQLAGNQPGQQPIQAFTAASGHVWHGSPPGQLMIQPAADAAQCPGAGAAGPAGQGAVQGVDVDAL